MQKTQPTPEFCITCTGDVVVGDRIRWTETVYSEWSLTPGARRKRKIGERTIEARVVADSYGAAKQQHTFSLLVERAFGKQRPLVGQRIVRKGRNIYRNGTRRAQWPDESKRLAALEEKHKRGDKARKARDQRKARCLSCPAPHTPEENRRRVRAMLPALRNKFQRQTPEGTP